MHLRKSVPTCRFRWPTSTFDLYKLVKPALKVIGPRLSHGRAIVFDKALSPCWPGEGIALLEFLHEQKYGQFKMFNIDSLDNQRTM